MQIRVNGSDVTIPEALTVDALLDQLGYRDRFVAVAVNALCIPRDSFSEHRIAERDAVEILAPMAGG